MHKTVKTARNLLSLIKNMISNNCVCSQKLSCCMEFRRNFRLWQSTLVTWHRICDLTQAVVDETWTAS